MRWRGATILAVSAVSLACGGFPAAGSPGSLARCAAYVDVPPAPPWPPELVVRGNVAAVQAEDLDCAMASFSPESPVFGATRVGTQGIFDGYDLDYRLDSIEVTSLHGDTALVTVVQHTASRVRGAAFRDNTVTAIHELRRTDGRWRFWGTTVLDVQYD